MSENRIKPTRNGKKMFGSVYVPILIKNIEEPILPNYTEDRKAKQPH